MRSEDSQILMLNLLERVSRFPLAGKYIYEYVQFVHLFLSSGASRVPSAGPISFIQTFAVLGLNRGNRKI